MTRHAERLEAAVRAVCPAIIGVSAGVIGDPATVRIDYADAATAQQRAAALAAVAGFDWSEAAQAAWERQQAAAAALSRTMTEADADSYAKRTILRVLATENNDLREAMALILDGQPDAARELLAGGSPAERRPAARVTEPQRLARIQAAVAAGAGDPVGG